MRSVLPLLWPDFTSGAASPGLDRCRSVNAARSLTRLRPKYAAYTLCDVWKYGSMYQGPVMPRTEASNPSGVIAIRSDAVGSSIPTPEYVRISGCRAARPGIITGAYTTLKRWKLPL